MARKHEAINSRKDMMMVDPQQIKIVEGWNPRTEFDKEELESLMNSIIVHGVKVPIRVKVNKDNEMILIDGERRLKATLMAIKKQYLIKSIPAIIERKTMKESDMLLLSMITNTGVPLKPIEEAEAIQRLLNYGMNIKSIALNLGKSKQFITNRLKLLDGTEELKEAVKNKDISIKDATEIIDKSAGNESEQKSKLAVKKVLKKAGIKKASRKELYQLLEDIYDDLENFEEFTQIYSYRKKILNIINREEHA